MNPTPLPSSSTTSGYATILKSTSIIGGSQALNYLIGMARNKVVALLLGPSGVGMVGLFTSSITLVGQLTGLGIDRSGVRQIAESQGPNDAEKAARTVRVLRRSCWITGILGWVMAVCFSRYLSIWAFESAENAWLISILGASLLLTAISGGQRALIQGKRRIRDLAMMTVLSSVASTIVAIAIYAIFLEKGIVPVIVASAAANLAISWWFARRIPVDTTEDLSWRETAREAKGLVNLGLAFMWGGFLAAFVDMQIRAMIVRDSGLDSAGMYQASWALSGLFATFILNAMGADFYPHLTSVADDNQKVNKLVNEQIEIGSLIAMPGLLVTLGFAPVLLTIFYSEKFVAGGAELLPWFVLGIYCRIISWPVGFVFLAKGASRWFAYAQTQFHLLNLFGAWYLLRHYGLQGVGLAFFLAFIPSVILNLFVSRRLSGFRWSRSVVFMIALNSLFVVLAFVSAKTLPVAWNIGVSFLLTIAASVLSIRGLAARVGERHRLIRTLLLIPGMRFLMYARFRN